MNLLPVTLTKNINSPGASGGNILSGAENTEQVSEFTGILSDSLIQQTPSPETTELAAQSLLPLPVPVVSGQDLPQTGEGLPLISSAIIADGAVAEGDVLASLSSTFSLTPVESAASPVPVIPALEAATGLAAGVVVEKPDTTLTMAVGVLNQEGVSSQLNSLSRHAAPGAALNAQAASPLLTLSHPGQTSTGDNSLMGQSQAMPVAEFMSAATDDKLDFSRIIEKGLLQLTKEPVSAQGVPATESTSRINLDSVKTATDSLQLQHSIDKPKWSHDFGSRMVWLTKEGVQTAQLKLTPAHLGTIEVKISIQNDQANVSFISQHGSVRDAIESSLPRLREMMQEAGVKLEQANVSSHSNANAQQHSSHSDKTAGHQSAANGLGPLGEDELSTGSAVSVGHESGLSGIDFYA